MTPETGKKKPTRADRDQADILRTLNYYLSEISTAEIIIAGIQAQCAAEVKEVTARYQAEIDNTKALLEAAKSALEKDALKHKGVVFAEGDRVDLPNGGIIYSRVPHVVQVKGALARIEAIGRLEAVKTVKSVDWDQVKGWPNEDLALIGSRREQREKIAYDLKFQI